MNARGWINRMLLTKRLTWIYDRFQKPQSLGARGELEAERFLLRKGWIILVRGFSTESGEIDLIAVDGKTLVFVEVKTRSNLNKGLPIEAVDQEKMNHIFQVAEQFYYRHQLEGTAVRFDVVSILWPGESDPEITHYQDAFDAPVQFCN